MLFNTPIKQTCGLAPKGSNFIQQTQITFTTSSYLKGDGANDSLDFLYGNTSSNMELLQQGEELFFGLLN